MKLLISFLTLLITLSSLHAEEKEGDYAPPLSSAITDESQSEECTEEKEVSVAQYYREHYGIILEDDEEDDDDDQDSFILTEEMADAAFNAPLESELAFEVEDEETLVAETKEVVVAAEEIETAVEEAVEEVVAAVEETDVVVEEVVEEAIAAVEEANVVPEEILVAVEDEGAIDLVHEFTFDKEGRLFHHIASQITMTLPNSVEPQLDDGVISNCLLVPYDAELQFHPGSYPEEADLGIVFSKDQKQIIETFALNDSTYVERERYFMIPPYPFPLQVINIFHVVHQEGGSYSLKLTCEPEYEEEFMDLLYPLVESSTFGNSQEQEPPQS
jgi:hypothetical protein